jgi:AcrR family transcriptional regulator
MEYQPSLAPVNTVAYGRGMADALSRDRWVDAALDALAERGIDAVAVEPLARRLRVTKGSFYWHFRDRDALLEAMLRRWEEVATTAIRDEVESGGGTPEAKLRALFAVAVRSARMDLETALRLWARRDGRVRRAVERVDERRMRYLVELFEALGLEPEEARARSFLAYASLFGDHFISAAGASLREGLLERCTALLLPPGPASAAPPPRRPTSRAVKPR